MELKLNVKKKVFKNKQGEMQEYFELSTEVSGEVVKLKLDKDYGGNALFKFLLGKLDIPVEAADDKNALITKLLNGEILTDAERERLEALVNEEEVK